MERAAGLLEQAMKNSRYKWLGIREVAVILAVGAVLLHMGWAMAEESIGREDLVRQIMNLVIEHNPILQSQRSLVAQIESLPDPGKGFDFELSVEGGLSTYVDEEDRQNWVGPRGGVTLEIPLFASSRRREQIMATLDYAKELEEARQDYLQMKSTVITELLSRLEMVFELENEKRRLKELKSFLDAHVEPLEQQVKTGVARATELVELMERIMNIATDMRNRTSELTLLRQEIAINLGGEKSNELLQMLDKLGVDK